MELRFRWGAGCRDRTTTTSRDRLAPLAAWKKHTAAVRALPFNSARDTGDVNSWRPV
jgi:hypothetical protein